MVCLAYWGPGPYPSFFSPSFERSKPEPRRTWKWNLDAVFGLFLPWQVWDMVLWPKSNTARKTEKETWKLDTICKQQQQQQQQQQPQQPQPQPQASSSFSHHLLKKKLPMWPSNYHFQCLGGAVSDRPPLQFEALKWYLLDQSNLYHLHGPYDRRRWSCLGKGAKVQRWCHFLNPEDQRWLFYLHSVDFLWKMYGKYTSPMDPMGNGALSPTQESRYTNSG